MEAFIEIVGKIAQIDEIVKKNKDFTGIIVTLRRTTQNLLKFRCELSYISQAFRCSLFMHNSIPMMITIFLENGFCKLSNMPFDSILAKLHFQQEIKNGTFDGDYYKQLPFLRMSDGIYHASKPFYEISHISNETIIKSFNLDLYLDLQGDMSNAPTITNNRSGRYKQHKVEFEIIYTDRIRYYLNGNYEYIEKLLQNLNFIGKKTSIGWGKIFSIEMEELKEDFSLLRDNTPSRHLPDIPKYRNKNVYKVNIPLTPPYWRTCSDIALVSKETL